jgi:hypothetical protein
MTVTLPSKDAREIGRCSLRLRQRHPSFETPSSRAQRPDPGANPHPDWPGSLAAAGWVGGAPHLRATGARAVQQRAAPAQSPVTCNYGGATRAWPGPSPPSYRQPMTQFTRRPGMFGLDGEPIDRGDQFLDPLIRASEPCAFGRQPQRARAVERRRTTQRATKPYQAASARPGRRGGSAVGRTR